MIRSIAGTIHQPASATICRALRPGAYLTIKSKTSDMYIHADLFVTPPDDLDPDRHRIVCQHFFGMDPEELRELRGLIALFDNAFRALAMDKVGDHA